MADTQRAPRVEACIQEAMEKYAGGSPGRDLTYYQNVHQDLAPLARELENALSVAKARIAELERATPPSPSTAPEVDERSLNESIDTPEFYETVSSWKENSPDAALWSDVISKINDYARREVAAALASRPAEVDDEGLPPLPDRYVGLSPFPGRKYFTAEQYRQGQRDAVAADRERAGRAMGLLREARAALEAWKDVAPAVSLCADIDKVLDGGAR